MYAHYNGDPRQQQGGQQQGGYPPPPPHAPYGYDAYGHPSQGTPAVPPGGGYHNHNHGPPHPPPHSHNHSYNYDPHGYHSSHAPPPHEYPPPSGYYNPTPPPPPHSHMPPPHSAHAHPGGAHPGSAPPVTSSAGMSSGHSGELRSVGIVTPHDHDVLCGRGGATNSHIGNTNYRKLVSHNKVRKKLILLD